MRIPQHHTWWPHQQEYQTWRPDAVWNSYNDYQLFLLLQMNCHLKKTYLLLLFRQISSNCFLVLEIVNKERGNWVWGRPDRQIRRFQTKEARLRSWKLRNNYINFLVDRKEIRIIWGIKIQSSDSSFHFTLAKKSPQIVKS